MLAAACADRDAFPVVGRRRLILCLLRVVCETTATKCSFHFPTWANVRFSSAVALPVYEIPSGQVLAAFSGHLKIVYNLCWSRDDRRLLSASSDGTVRWAFLRQTVLRRCARRLCVCFPHSPSHSSTPASGTLRCCWQRPKRFFPTHPLFTASSTIPCPRTWW